MAENPYVNKVVFGNDTLVDLTEDSVTANTLLEGETAHSASGEPITGTAKQGHTIWNAIKTALTQRTKLWFADAKVTDDSTEEATKVEVVQLIDDESELTNAPDGVYQGDYEDEPEYVLDASMVAYNDGSVEDALDGAKIFYKDVQIAGVTISNYWAHISSGVSISDYTVIGFAEGGIWDEKIYFSVGLGNSLNIKSQTASYTIPSNRTPIRMYFVKNNRVNATPLT